LFLVTQDDDGIAIFDFDDFAVEGIGGGSCSFTLSPIALNIPLDGLFSAVAPPTPIKNSIA